MNQKEQQQAFLLKYLHQIPTHNQKRQIFPSPQKPGEVFTFGSAVSGELGLGPSIHERRKPGLVKLLKYKQIVALECGGQHTLALDIEGRVYSWGVNDQGALGRMTDEDMKKKSDDDSDDEDVEELKGNEAWAPLLVDLKEDDQQPAKIIQMVCADSFSAVLSDRGNVFAWGSFRDPSGVIGFSKDMHHQIQKLPRKLSVFKENVVLLGSGENHIFAVTNDDTLWAFGANDENQLGRRVSARLRNNLEPYQIAKHPALHGILKITGGAYHTLLVNAKGQLFSFGCNNCGQLGLGDALPHISGPEWVQFYVDEKGNRHPLPPIVDVAAGESHSLAISKDGVLFSWGANLESQLGYETVQPIYGDRRDLPSSGSSSLTNSPCKAPVLEGSFKDKFQPLPRPIPQSSFLPGEQLIQCDAQSRFSIAVSSFGNLYTWGSGHCYQLGNEELEDEQKPFLVQLKERKCFWARCGGQFTMFLLDYKQQQMKSSQESLNQVSVQQQQHQNQMNGHHKEHQQNMTSSLQNNQQMDMSSSNPASPLKLSKEMPELNQSIESINIREPKQRSVRHQPYQQSPQREKRSPSFSPKKSSTVVQELLVSPKKQKISKEEKAEYFLSPNNKRGTRQKRGTRVIPMKQLQNDDMEIQEPKAMSTRRGQLRQ